MWLAVLIRGRYVGERAAEVIGDIDGAVDYAREEVSKDNQAASSA